MSAALLARGPRRDEVVRFVRFLALGGLAAGINWLSRFAWEPWLGFSAAVVAAYATGMLVAFLLFRAFVFPASPAPIGRQVSVFVLVNLLGVLQVWLVANGLARVVHPALAHAVGIAVPTLTSWFGHRMLTFGR